MKQAFQVFPLPASLVLFAATALAADSSTIEFSGRIVGITTLREHSGSAINTHADPRYALTVDVLSARPKSSQFVDGKRVVLAIHSPALLFSSAGEDLTRQTFDFAITQTTDGGRTSYSALSAKKSEMNEAGGLSPLDSKRSMFAQPSARAPAASWNTISNRETTP